MWLDLKTMLKESAARIVKNLFPRLLRCFVFMPGTAVFCGVANRAVNK